PRSPARTILRMTQRWVTSYSFLHWRETKPSSDVSHASFQLRVPHPCALCKGGRCCRCNFRINLVALDENGRPRASTSVRKMPSGSHQVPLGVKLPDSRLRRRAVSVCAT